MNKGLLIVFSGPSGVGKGTILNELIDDEELKLSYSVSMTTRNPREGEKDGTSYFFVTKDRFEEAIENGELLEHAEFVGNYYGTPKGYVDKMREEGRNVILEIEVVGAKQVLQRCPDALSIFIVPPSLEELEKRIRGRKTETEEVIRMRIEKAKHELQETDLYDYVICNEDITSAADEVRRVILDNMNKNEKEPA